MAVCLLLAGCGSGAPSDGHPSASTCWPLAEDDDLGEGFAGLGVSLSTFTADCEEIEGDTDGERFRHYDAAERVDHAFGRRHVSYERRDSWDGAECATLTTYSYEEPGAVHGDIETVRTCEDGWPIDASIHSVGFSDASWDNTSYQAWQYTWEGGAPATIERYEGNSSNALSLAMVESRFYLDDVDGTLARVETEDSQGNWDVTLYDWENGILVGKSYASRYDTHTTTWSYDAQGRVAGWWSDFGGIASGTYTYVDGTRRPSSSTIDEAGVDGVLDGTPDAYVLYTWSAGDQDP